MHAQRDAPLLRLVRCRWWRPWRRGRGLLSLAFQARGREEGHAEGLGGCPVREAQHARGCAARSYGRPAPAIPGSRHAHGRRRLLSALGRGALATYGASLFQRAGLCQWLRVPARSRAPSGAPLTLCGQGVPSPVNVWRVCTCSGASVARGGGTSSRSGFDPLLKHFVELEDNSPCHFNNYTMNNDSHAARYPRSRVPCSMAVIVHRVIVEMTR